MSEVLSTSRQIVLLGALLGIVTLTLSGCAGVVSPSGAQTNPNPTALAISNVQASAAASSVQLSWTTNLPSTSAIDYGTTAAYGTSTPVNSAMVMTHQMGIASLSRGTTYHYRVRSSAGSSSAASNDQTFTTNNSNTAPSISITSPAAGATLSGNVNLTAVASDAGGVASVQFQVDGGNVGSSLTAAPYIYVISSTTLANGSHTIGAIATDNAGFSTASAVVNVKVDNTTKDTTPPSVTVTSPVAGAKVSGTVAVTATASDNVSVAHVQFQLDGANLGNVDLASPFVINWDTSKVTNGPHVLQAIATDGAGNSATSVPVTVTVNNTAADTTPPVVSITAPINGATVSGNLNVTATAADNVGVASVQFQVDGANVGSPDAATPYALSLDTTKLSNGTHRLDAVAKDAAGNTTTSALLTVTVSNAAAQTFSVSGTISPTAGGNGATVTLSGTAGATTTANASGVYTFTGLANGTYTVTPSHTGFTFTPASKAATVAGANVTGVNFTATANPAPTFSISGTISPTAGGNGATVTLSGTASATTTANASGAYTFAGLTAGTYAITPSHTGFTLSPTTQSVTISAADVTGVNFTATAQTNPTFSISGTITPISGGGGATVILSGAAGATTTTNASGAYTFTGLANGTYTVTPNNSGFTFTPGSQSVAVNGTNKTGVNFTAATNNPASVTLTWNASTSTVSGYNVYRSTVSGMGYVKLNSSLISGMSFDDTTVQSGTTYFYVATSVDSGGDESVNSNQASATIP